MSIHLSQSQNANLPFSELEGQYIRPSISKSECESTFLRIRRSIYLSIYLKVRMQNYLSQKENADALTLRSVASTFPLVRLKLVHPAKDQKHVNRNKNFWKF